jgi:cytochrome P450/NADPH-cytochrome P450 reductase
VVIVSASYNGTPPDNAAAFCQWISGNLAPHAFDGVHYTVFGCGNRDWTATYQAIPVLIDAELAAHGATRVHPRGEGDARDDFDGQFRAWYGSLWSDLAQGLNLGTIESDSHLAQGHLYEVEVLTEEPGAPLAASYNAVSFPITANRELQRHDGSSPSRRSTRHLELTLPSGTRYQAGDYLGVVPRNHPDLVARAMRQFAIPTHANIRIRSNLPTRTQLPLDQPVPITVLLSDYVELQDAATRAQIQTMAAYTECPPDREQLQALGSDAPENIARYRDTVLTRRVSMLDLMETFPSCSLPFNVFLELLTPLRPRFYSISSSPRADPAHCSITVGVVEGAARSGQGIYHGACSTYLATREPGSAVSAFTQAPSTPFRPPANPATPMIMVGPGTGLAPFRGFLQERAALAANGAVLGKAMLFFGCRNPNQDFIYQDELLAYAAQGIVDLHLAFSRSEDRPKTYVQDSIKSAEQAVWQLLEAGAVIYVCGDASKMAPDVRRAFAAIYRGQTGASDAMAETWLTGLTASGRYIADVWAA